VRRGDAEVGAAPQGRALRVEALDSRVAAQERSRHRRVNPRGEPPNEYLVNRHPVVHAATATGGLVRQGLRCTPTRQRSGYGTAGTEAEAARVPHGEPDLPHADAVLAAARGHDFQIVGGFGSGGSGVGLGPGSGGPGAGVGGPGIGSGEGDGGSRLRMRCAYPEPPIRNTYSSSSFRAALLMQ